MWASKAISISFVTLGLLEEPVEAVFDGEMNGTSRVERSVARADFEEVKQRTGSFTEDNFKGAEAAKSEIGTSVERMDRKTENFWPRQLMLSG